MSGSFWLLKRSVIKKLIEAYPELRIRCRDDPQHLYYAFFAEMVLDGKWLSEDGAFCDRWRAIGGTIYVDPSIALRHHVEQAIGRSLADELSNPARRADLADALVRDGRA